MAVNSAASRSQDQLHIHVACIAPKVAEFLRRHQAEIHEAWSFLSAGLLGHRSAAMKVETDSLAHVDPFKLLARDLPSGKFSMGSQTLAVIGATFGGGRIGFYPGQSKSAPDRRLRWLGRHTAKYFSRA
jgi:CDP-diacylglycerol pyrophosphatase